MKDDWKYVGTGYGKQFATGINIIVITGSLITGVRVKQKLYAVSLGIKILVSGESVQEVLLYALISPYIRCYFDNAYNCF